MALFGKGKSTDPLVLMKGGDYKGAIKLLQEKLKKNPSDVSTVLRLAEAFKGAGDKDSAARLYVKEGESNIENGQKAQGIVLLKKAAKLNPSDSDLVAKISSLESVPAPSAQSSFSFDMDVAEETPKEEEKPAETPVEAETEEEPPPAQEDKAGEGEEGAPSEVQADYEADIEIEQEIEVPPGRQETHPAEVHEPAGDALTTFENGQPEGDQGTSPATEPEASIVPEVEVIPEVDATPEISVDEPQDESETAAGEPEPEVTVEPEVAAEDSGASPPSRLFKAEDPVALMQELFPGLSHSDAVSIGASLKKIDLDPGQVLIKEGEEGQSLYLVMDGCLEASSSFEDKNLRLGLLKRCDVIGEVAFLKEVRRTATVVALEPSVVLELSRDATAEHLKEEPDLLNRLESILDERVQRTIQTLKESLKES